MNDQINPYRPPADAILTEPPNAARELARRQLRITLAILLIPGIHNYLCYDQLRTLDMGLTISTWWRALDVAQIGFLAIIIWFAGLPFLESVTRVLHHWLSRQADLRAWQSALYEVLATTTYFALAGAALWFIWNIGYFYLHIHFFTLSVPVGMAAHLLAAGLYVRLFYRWYCLERRPARS